MSSWFVVAMFIIATLYVAARHAKRSCSFDEFALSKGFFGAFPLMTSIAATAIGSGFILGVGEKVYSQGFIYALCLLAGQPFQFILLAAIAPRLRRFQHCFSIGDILERRYDKRVRYACGIFWVLFCVGIITVQMAAIGRVAALILPIPIWLGSLVGGAIIIGYCSLCGIRGVVSTDVIQLCLILLGILFVITAGIHYLGGYGAFIHELNTEQIIGLADLGVVGALSLFLSFALGDFMIPPMVQRVMMARSHYQAALALSSACVVVVLIAAGAGFLGLLASVVNPDASVQSAINELLLMILPGSLVSVAICAILAAIMSSADSYLNTAAIAAVRDALPIFLKRALSEQQQLFIMRLAVVVIGGVAMVFSLYKGDLLSILLYAFNFWGPTVVVPLLGALFYQKLPPRLFFVPASIGLLTALSWDYFTLADQFYLSGLIAGMLACGVVYSIMLVIIMRCSPCLLIPMQGES
ncbi:sodium:solute symporter family protein [Kistimonas asteriae]|uniref:sodium:solute symporter family protein n=1 Tax=Kistimonas asteriae TaxID=517724 RepID=UPI001BA76A75|nr:sodium:solute symporter family protein [Kistimonas asteriae]